MLKGLNDVPWSELTHAYGSASDVPELIRTVAFGDKSERDKAWYELYGNIWHQETLYEATSYAVPFFIEVLDDCTTGEEATLLTYLYDLSNGTSYLDVHQDIVSTPEERSSVAHEAQLSKELLWVKMAQDSVQLGRPIFARFLESNDTEISDAAKNLLRHLDTLKDE